MSAWTLGRSWLVYGASYAVAGAAAAGAAMFTGGDPFLQAVAGGVAATVVLYLCSIVFKKSGPAGQESGQSFPNVYLIEITDGKVGMKTL